MLRNEQKNHIFEIVFLDDFPCLLFCVGLKHKKIISTKICKLNPNIVFFSYIFKIENFLLKRFSQQTKYKQTVAIQFSRAANIYRKSVQCEHKLMKMVICILINLKVN